MMNARIAAALLLLPSLAACAGEGGEAGRIAAVESPPAVDTARPPAESLLRFRAELPPVDSLGGGFATDRDSLVGRIVQALERADTAALAEMSLSRGEFAYLYYETSPTAQPGYDLPADLSWFQLAGNSEKGVGRALREVGGRELGLMGHDCADVREEGRNRIWSGCVVRFRDTGGADGALRLFSALIERDGRFKVLSYANDL